MDAGKFITFEGGEGAGKSTQAQALAERLRKAGHTVHLTREPGGSERAEEIRDFLLSGKAKAHGPLAEAILFSVARDDHLEQAIRPALGDAAWVVCDRFSDSTRAYQGAAGLGDEVLQTLDRVIVAATQPDLTIILDVPAETGLARAAARAAANGSTPGDGAANGSDRFEEMDLAHHQAIRRNFLAIAKREPERCVVIDAQKSEKDVSDEIWKIVRERLDP